MKSPDDVKQWVKQRYTRQRWRWLDGSGAWPLEVALGTPTQRAALADPAAVRRWMASWASWRDSHSGDGSSAHPELSSVTLAWKDMGEQTLPAALTFRSAECVANFCGDRISWRRITRRRAQMLELWPNLEASGFGPHYASLGDYEDPEFDRLLSVLKWFVANPASGIYLRQLPVPGVDTKWIDLQRRGIVADLFRRITRLPTRLAPSPSAVTSSGQRDEAEPDRGVDIESDIAQSSAQVMQEASSNFYDICGLRRPPTRLRLLVLCPALRLQTAGLRDIEATVEDLAQLQLRPTQLLVVENKDTCLSMPDVMGVVAIIKLGNAVSLVRQLPWLDRVPVLYWGDIDTYGYSILVQARKTLHGVRSVLMDESTVTTHLDRLVDEAVQTKNVECALLTPQEQAVYEGLLAGTWGNAKRLEQERLEWPAALREVLSSLQSMPTTLEEPAQAPSSWKPTD